MWEPTAHLKFVKGALYQQWREMMMTTTNALPTLAQTGMTEWRKIEEGTLEEVQPTST